MSRGNTLNEGSRTASWWQRYEWELPAASSTVAVVLYSKRRRVVRRRTGPPRRIKKAALIDGHQRGFVGLLGSGSQRFAAQLNAAVHAFPFTFNQGRILLFFNHFTTDDFQQLRIKLRQPVGEAPVDDDRFRSSRAVILLVLQALPDLLREILAHLFNQLVNRLLFPVHKDLLSKENTTLDSVGCSDALAGSL